MNEQMICPNETIRQLFQRRSVRVFEDKEISSDDKAAILRSAVMAPSAGCQQLYTILDITDQQLKEELVKTCDNQPFIAKAKMVLIFLADCRKWYDAFQYAGCEPRKPGAGDLMLAVTDAAIAAQNAVTAAESLGIGSCYIGDVMENYEKQRDLLDLPEYVFPACMVVFGYPTEEQKSRKKPQRASMEYIVHENTYREMDSDELHAMLAYKAGIREYRDWIRSFCDFKFNSDFSREMTRSVEKYLDQFE